MTFTDDDFISSLDIDKSGAEPMLYLVLEFEDEEKKKIAKPILQQHSRSFT